MTTLFVCPIDGAVPADNGTDTSKANNVVVVAPTISAVTPTGTAGTTTYGYKVSAVGPLGETPASAEVTTTTGNATLSGTNYNAISWSAITGATSYNVYGRTASGENLLLGNTTGTSFNDTGVAGTAATPPTVFSYPAPHCPLCGSAMVLVDQSKVTSLTGVAAASQHPADIDAVYVTNTFSAEAQFGATAYTVQGQRSNPYPHKFAALNRGSATVTAQTINTVTGP